MFAETSLPALDPMPIPGPPWLFHLLWLVTFAVHVVGVNVVLAPSSLPTPARLRARLVYCTRRLSRWTKPPAPANSKPSCTSSFS